MSRSRGDILTLDLSQKPQNDRTPGSYDSHGTTFTVTKDTTNVPGGFFKLIHTTEKTPFQLEIYLPNGQTITKTKGARGQPIPNVESVYVYFWCGNDNNPILLGVETDKIRYYSHRPDGGTKQGTWSPAGSNTGKPLVQLLDENNCQHNQAVPFEITDPTNYYTKYNSYCIKSIRNITGPNHPPPQKPPNSEYNVKEYTVHNNDPRDPFKTGTKISRVTYNGNSINITPPQRDAVSKVRVYSYPGGSDDIPLMLEFRLKDTEESRWYYSQSPNGLTWAPAGIAESQSYYKDGDLSQPADTLSNKLDDLLCLRNNNVTLDLTYNRYTTGEKYCCNSHSDNMHRKVTVTNEKVKVGDPPIPYYKHDISKGLHLFGIKYNEGGKSGQRQKVKISGLPFPISGVQAVYVFYCDMGNPVLIYVDSPENTMAKRWYKKQSDSNNNEQWVMTSSIDKNTEPYNIKDCPTWNKLYTVLSDLQCTNLGKCTEPTQPSPPQGTAGAGEAGPSGGPQQQSTASSSAPKAEKFAVETAATSLWLTFGASSGTLLELVLLSLL